MIIHPYIIVGSGCSGAMAAQTLVEAGENVTMLDFGVQKSLEEGAIPDANFLSLRAEDKLQYKYLIGDRAKGVAWGPVGKGEQITPSRMHLSDLVNQYIPFQSSTFSPLESLGYGGLGIGWGLQCWKYSKADIKAAGLGFDALENSYQTISGRIGICSSDDEATPYTTRVLSGLYDSPKMDRNHEYIHGIYLKKKNAMMANGLYLGRTPLALITDDREDRKAYAYKDMDFYSDNDRSAWRPWITVDKLKKESNFNYVGGLLVLSFKEFKTFTELKCLEKVSNTIVIFKCRKLILASSTLGTSRIVMRSLGNESTKLPLLCNPYSYVPCIQPRFIGQAAEPQKLGFTQLSLFLDRENINTNVSVASLYSYQSLMLFRLMRHIPLNYKDARVIMRYLMSGLVIMGIHHPDHHTPHKSIRLIQDGSSPTDDRLEIFYSLDDKEKSLYAERESDFIKAMRKMGTYALKKIDPGFGASIHYAGTLPFSDDQRNFTLDPSGKLHGTKTVYVADSSGFKFLPAPGLTFTLMANAHNVATASMRHR